MFEYTEVEKLFCKSLKSWDYGIPLVLMHRSFACHLFSKPVTESDIASDEAC